MAMQRSGVRFTGGEHDASTEWNIRWNYQTSSDGSGCRVSSYQVTMDVIFHYAALVHGLHDLLSAQNAMGWLRESAAKTRRRSRAYRQGLRPRSGSSDQEDRHLRQRGQLDGELHQAVAMILSKYNQRDRIRRQDGPTA